nr:MAG TPA: hypothetical protein [Caudoviricetes sp.]
MPLQGATISKPPIIGVWTFRGFTVSKPPNNDGVLRF